MTNRRQSPLHDKWHRRVEGQIRHTMNEHPEWFRFRDEHDRQTCVNSLAKRICGEIVAEYTVATVPGRVAMNCPRPVDDGGGGSLPPSGGGVVKAAASPDSE